MHLTTLVGYLLMLMMLVVPDVYADDPCLGDEEKKAALTRSAALQKAEQTGQSTALFVAYMQIMADDCMDRYDKHAVVRAKANISKLGRDLAKAAETKGALYSGDPVRADSQTTAFRFYETIGDHQEPTVFCSKPFRLNQMTCACSRRPGISITADTDRSIQPWGQDNPIVLHQHSGMNSRKWPPRMPIG